MIMGQTAGSAAALASARNQSVQDVDVLALQGKLRDGKALLDVDLSRFSEYLKDGQ